jgi:integrase
MYVDDANGIPVRVQRSAVTKREAVRKLDRILAEARVRAYAPDMQLGFLLEKWLEYVRSRVAAKTFEQYEGVVRIHIMPRLGAKKVNGIRPEMIEHHCQELAAEGKVRIPGLFRSVLKRVLRFAQREGIVERNVADLTDPPKIRRREKRVIGPNEAEAALAATENPTYRALFRFLADTGVRPNEAYSLQWDDLVRESDGTVWAYIRKSKTQAGERPRPLAEDLYEELKAIRAESVFVFPSATGTKLGHRNVVRAWHRALEQTGQKPLPVYALRHLYGSVMATAGVAPLTLAGLMGHSSPRVTQDYYQQALRDDMRKAAESLRKARSKDAVKDAVPEMGADNGPKS